MIHEIRPLIPVPKLTDERMLELYKKLMEEKPKSVPNIQNGFYRIDLQEILSSTTPEYRSFLKEAGYGNLDLCSHLYIAKNMLRIDQNVRGAASRNGIKLAGNDEDYVVHINQTNARELVEAMGYKLLTTGLMYNLFIPYIKDLVKQGNAEAKKTLDEMVNTKGEWLEDLILDKNRVKIGAKERTIILSQNDGRFDRININQFGYPTAAEKDGEFHYWFPEGDKRAAIRDLCNFVLGLNLDTVPSFVGFSLGVRAAKIRG